MASHKDPEKRRESHRKYMRDWYQKNKSKQLKYNKSVKKAYKAWWKEYKATLSCNRCGENHPATIDFHHKNPAEKKTSVYELTNNNMGRERVMEEVAKCEVLCANCHRKEHWEEGGNGL